MNLFKSKLVASSVALFVIILSSIYWLKSHQTSAIRTECNNNLIIIDLCKNNWANVHNKTAGYRITWDEIKPELESYALQYGWSNGVPRCPDGGYYTLEPIGEPPTCSIGGPDHSLPR